MRRLILLAIILLQLTNSIAQPDNRPLVPKYTGDTVTITGRIYAGNYLKNVITKPTFLNVYDSSPLHMLMIRIDSADRKNFPEDPEKYYLNKKVSIKGVLGDYKGITTMTLMSPSLVEIDLKDKGPEPITSTGSYMSGHDFGFGKSDSMFRKKQDSIGKILAADPTRKNKKYIPKYQTNNTGSNNTNNIKKEPTNSDNDNIAISTQPKEQIEKLNQEIPVAEQPNQNPPSQVTDTASTEVVQVIENNETTDTIPIVNPTVDKIKNTEIIIPKNNDKIYNTKDTASRAKYLKSISSQEFETANEVWVVNDGEIEMRTSPNMDAPVLAYLMKQMTIRITNKSKKWSYVTVENPDGTIGLSGFIKNKAIKDMGKIE